MALYLHERYDTWGRSYPNRGELHYVFSEQRALTSAHEMMHNRNSSFWSFYKKVNVDNWRQILEDAFGKKIQKIDFAFQKFIANQVI